MLQNRLVPDCSVHSSFDQHLDLTDFAVRREALQTESRDLLLWRATYSKAVSLHALRHAKVKLIADLMRPSLQRDEAGQPNFQEP